MSHTIHAVKFELTNMYIYDGKVSQMHRVLMRLYPIDKSFVCSQNESERHVRIATISIIREDKYVIVVEQIALN